MANGDNNTDGEAENHSWNCGVEGQTDDDNINALRARQKRNFLATLLLSQGIPMITSGDEIGKTQKGNNNAYCQDNEISWINWQNKDEGLLKFTQDLIKLRLKHPSLRRKEWIVGDRIDSDGLLDIAWFSPSGKIMETEDWQEDRPGSIGIFLHGEGIQGKAQNGKDILDVHFFLVFNAHHDVATFKLPAEEYALKWSVEISTGECINQNALFGAGSRIEVGGRTLMVLRAG
jgi:isoamylase